MPAAFRAHRVQPGPAGVSPPACPHQPPILPGDPSPPHPVPPRPTPVSPSPPPVSPSFRLTCSNSPGPAPAWNSFSPGPSGAPVPSPALRSPGPLSPAGFLLKGAPFRLWPLPAWSPAPCSLRRHTSTSRVPEGAGPHSSLGPGTSLGDPSRCHELTHHTASHDWPVPAAPALALSTQLRACLT